MGFDIIEINLVVKFIITSHPTNFDSFFHENVLHYQYQIIINELSIVIMIISNIPEIIVKIMMYFSIPMFERLKITLNLLSNSKS